MIPAIMGFAMGQAQNAPAVKEPGINVNYMDKRVITNRIELQKLY